MRVLVKEQGSVISDVVCAREPIHIGSQPGCHLRLPDMRIELVHAVLAPSEDGGWTIEHTAGGAKTWLNGHVLQGTKRIINGDQIEIEDFTLQVYLDLDEHPDDTDAGAAAASIRMADEYPLPAGSIVRSRREALSLSPAQLQNLSRFALKLGTCKDIAGIMETVSTELLPLFLARAVWIGVRRQGRGPLKFIQGRDSHDNVYDLPKQYSSLLNRCVDRGANVWIPLLEDDDTTSIIAASILTPNGTLGMVYLDSRKDADAFSERDFEHLIALTTVIASQLDLLIREQAQWRKQVTSAESSIVQTIQTQLDPQELPEWPTLQVAAHCSHGQDHAGDVYDIMRMPNGVAAFFIGHVSAPPVTAAIAMVEARTAFRVAVLHADMPHAMMRELNWLICTRNEKITMQCAIVLVDPKNGALLQCTAGPTCAVIIGRSGSPRRLTSPNTPLLGAKPNHPYAPAKGLLGANESLAMFTSGVTRLRNEKGDELPEHRFYESLGDGFGMAARKALDETCADLNAYAERGYRPDDVTILLAHRPAAPAPEV